MYFRGLEDTFLLFGTPPKRKQTSVSDSEGHNTPNQTITPVKSGTNNGAKEGSMGTGKLLNFSLAVEDQVKASDLLDYVMLVC